MNKQEIARLTAKGLTGELAPVQTLGTMDKPDAVEIVTILLKRIHEGTRITTTAIKKEHAGLKRLEEVMQRVVITHDHDSLRFLTEETLRDCSKGLRDSVDIHSGPFKWIREGSLQVFYTAIQFSQQAMKNPRNHNLQQLCYLFSKQPIVAASINLLHSGNPDNIAREAENLRKLVDPLSPLTGLGWLIHVTRSDKVLKRNQVISRVCGFNPHLSGDQDYTPSLEDLQGWVMQCRMEINFGHSLRQTHKIFRADRETLEFNRICLDTSAIIKELGQRMPRVEVLIPTLRSAAGITTWKEQTRGAIEQGRKDISKYLPLLSGLSNQEPEQRKLARRMFKQAFSSEFDYRMMLHANSVTYQELTDALLDRQPLHQPSATSTHYLLKHPRELAGHWQRGYQLDQRISDVVTNCRNGKSLCIINAQEPHTLQVQPR